MARRREGERRNTGGDVWLTEDEIRGLAQPLSEDEDLRHKTDEVVFGGWANKKKRVKKKTKLLSNLFQIKVLFCFVVFLGGEKKKSEKMKLSKSCCLFVVLMCNNNKKNQEQAVKFNNSSLVVLVGKKQIEKKKLSSLGGQKKKNVKSCCSTGQAAESCESMYSIYICS